MDSNVPSGPLTCLNWGWVFMSPSTFLALHKNSSCRALHQVYQLSFTQPCMGISEANCMLKDSVAILHRLEPSKLTVLPCSSRIHHDCLWHLLILGAFRGFVIRARPNWAPRANLQTAMSDIPPGYYFNPYAFAMAIVQPRQPTSSAHDLGASAGDAGTDIASPQSCARPGSSRALWTRSIALAQLRGCPGTTT